MSYGSKHTTVDGVKKIGSNLYGTCSTGAGTKAKVVDLDGFDVLVEGVTIHVKFTYYNYASNCTLKVGSTEARPLRRNGSSYGEWDSGAVVSFTYDGTVFEENPSSITGGKFVMSDCWVNDITDAVSKGYAQMETGEVVSATNLPDLIQVGNKTYKTNNKKSHQYILCVKRIKNFCHFKPSLLII